MGSISETMAARAVLAVTAASLLAVMLVFALSSPQQRASVSSSIDSATFLASDLCTGDSGCHSGQRCEGSSWFNRGKCISATADSCPDYSAIRQPSVSAEQFDIADFSGVWYMLATNEPTMPSFCTCGVNNITVDKPALTYSYSNANLCFGKDFTIHIAGDLSKDAASPGDLHENAVILDHTLGKLLPNYVFRIERDETLASKPIVRAYTYACLGKILGEEKFSFNVLSRSYEFDRPAIEQLVQKATASVPAGVMDTDGLRYNTQEEFNKCAGEASGSTTPLGKYP